MNAALAKINSKTWVLMNAALAKINSKTWLDNAQKENKEYNLRRLAAEKKESLALWRTVGIKWVSKIDGWIQEASSKGKHGTYASSRINPDGDTVIWLASTDKPIYELLMKHYRDRGFDVNEYYPLGIEITW